MHYTVCSTFHRVAPFQKEAIIVYQQYITDHPPQNKQKQPTPIEPIESTGLISKTIGDVATTLPEDLAEQLAQKLIQAGKKRLTVTSLQKAFETYIPLESQARGWSDEGYVRKIKSDIQLFIDLVKVENCCDLNNELIVYYSDTVRQLPRKYDSNPRCRGLSFEEMVKLEDEKMTSPKTIKNKVNNVIAFIEWCEGRNYIDVEYKKPFKTIRKVRGGSKKGGIPVASAREIVGHEDEDMSYGGYADPLDLPSKKKVIDKIKYPSVDWNLVKEREWRQNQQASPAPPQPNEES